MFDKLIYAGIVFAGFFAIMNPIAGISIFLTLTHNETEVESKTTAFHAVVTAFLIVVVFSVAGHYLMHFFGISITALRLAGGILIGIIGYEMLLGQQSNVSNPTHKTIQETKKEEASVAISPLGTPLLAGPGVIITAMNFSAGGFVNLIITIFTFWLLCVITYFVFIWGKKIKKTLGVNFLIVLTKLMGLILIFIGTQMFVEGVYTAIQEFPKVHYF